MTSSGRLTAVFFCCSLLTVYQPADVIADAESYAVFAAVLKPMVSRAQVTVLEETRPGPTCSASSGEWRIVDENHKKENARVRTLHPDADLRIPYSLLSMAELRSLMRRAGYDLSKFAGEQSPGAQVFRGLPGGRLIAFSAVGFDEQKTRAIVTVQIDCFPQAEGRPPSRYCHQFSQLKLEKQVGRWVPALGVSMCGGGA